MPTLKPYIFTLVFKLPMNPINFPEEAFAKTKPEVFVSGCWVLSIGTCHRLECSLAIRRRVLRPPPLLGEKVPDETYLPARDSES